MIEITKIKLIELSKNWHDNGTPASKALRSISSSDDSNIESRIDRVNRQIAKGLYSIKDLQENAKIGQRVLIKNDEVKKAIKENRNIGDTWVNSDNEMCAYEYPLN